MSNKYIKDQIDAFLSENERATKSIERLANNYSMSDFVHITPKCADGIRATKRQRANISQGVCMT